MKRPDMPRSIADISATLRTFGRGRLLCLSLLAGVAAAVLIAPTQERRITRRLADGLRVSDEATPADYIYVLAGDPGARFARAAELHRDGSRRSFWYPRPRTRPGASVAARSVT